MGDHDRPTPLPPEEDDSPTDPAIPVVTCPKCRGHGYILQLDEWATRHVARAVRCNLCDGLKQTDRETAARYVAWPKASPPPNE